MEAQEGPNEAFRVHFVRGLASTIGSASLGRLRSLKEAGKFSEGKDAIPVSRGVMDALKSVARELDQAQAHEGYYDLCVQHADDTLVPRSLSVGARRHREAAPEEESEGSEEQPQRRELRWGYMSMLARLRVDGEGPEEDAPPRRPSFVRRPRLTELHVRPAGKATPAATAAQPACDGTQPACADAGNEDGGSGAASDLPPLAAGGAGRPRTAARKGGRPARAPVLPLGPEASNASGPHSDQEGPTAGRLEAEACMEEWEKEEQQDVGSSSDGCGGGDTQAEGDAPPTKCATPQASPCPADGASSRAPSVVHPPAPPTAPPPPAPANSPPPDSTPLGVAERPRRPRPPLQSSKSSSAISAPKRALDAADAASTPSSTKPPEPCPFACRHEGCADPICPGDLTCPCCPGAGAGCPCDLVYSRHGWTTRSELMLQAGLPAPIDIRLRRKAPRRARHGAVFDNDDEDSSDSEQHWAGPQPIPHHLSRLDPATLGGSYQRAAPARSYSVGDFLLARSADAADGEPELSLSGISPPGGYVAGSSSPHALPARGGSGAYAAAAYARAMLLQQRHPLGSLLPPSAAALVPGDATAALALVSASSSLSAAAATVATAAVAVAGVPPPNPTHVVLPGQCSAASEASAGLKCVLPAMPRHLLGGHRAAAQPLLIRGAKQTEGGKGLAAGEEEAECSGSCRSALSASQLELDVPVLRSSGSSNGRLGAAAAAAAAARAATAKLKLGGCRVPGMGADAAMSVGCHEDQKRWPVVAASGLMSVVGQAGAGGEAQRPAGTTFPLHGSKDLMRVAGGFVRSSLDLPRAAAGGGSGGGGGLSFGRGSLDLPRGAVGSSGSGGGGVSFGRGSLDVPRRLDPCAESPKLRWGGGLRWAPDGGADEPEAGFEGVVTGRKANSTNGLYCQLDVELAARAAAMAAGGTLFQPSQPSQPAPQAVSAAAAGGGSGSPLRPRAASAHRLRVQGVQGGGVAAAGEAGVAAAVGLEATGSSSSGDGSAGCRLRLPRLAN